MLLLAKDEKAAVIKETFISHFSAIRLNDTASRFKNEARVLLRFRPPAN
jgi:hypothetical protein